MSNEYHKKGVDHEIVMRIEVEWGKEDKNAIETEGRCRCLLCTVAKDDPNHYYCQDVISLKLAFVW